jgi:hypothetical protein
MTLTGFEKTWGQAALGAMFPGSREDGFDDIVRMDVRGFLADVTKSLTFKAALGLRVALWLVAFAPLFVLGRLVTLPGLQAAERERVIAALSESRWYTIRSLAMLLKTFGAMLYAGDERIRARLLPALPTPPATPVRSTLASSIVPLRIRRAHVA